MDLFIYWLIYILLWTLDVLLWIRVMNTKRKFSTLQHITGGENLFHATRSTLGAAQCKRLAAQWRTLRACVRYIVWARSVCYFRLSVRVIWHCGSLLFDQYLALYGHLDWHFGERFRTVTPLPRTVTPLPLYFLSWSSWYIISVVECSV
jgi:hypothetical protein